MEYAPTKQSGFLLFLLHSLIAAPLFSLLSKASSSLLPSVTLVALIAGTSGLCFLLSGEFFRQTPMSQAYGSFLVEPAFYGMTVLFVVVYWVYFQLLAYFPVTIVACFQALSPVVIYYLRHLYRPRSIKTRVGLLTLLGIVASYLLLFGLDHPSLQAGMVGGLAFLSVYLLTRPLYIIEKETAANQTNDWGDSLRLGGLHRTLGALCLLPMIEPTAQPFTVLSPSDIVVIGTLIVAASSSWFLGLHVSRILNAYYSSYFSIVRLGPVAIGEAIIFGVILLPGQYAGLVVLCAVLYYLYYDLYDER